MAAAAQATRAARAIRRGVMGIGSSSGALSACGGGIAASSGPGVQSRQHSLTAAYFNKGDQAGSEAGLVYGAALRIRPETSTVHKREPPPGVSRENISTRPLGAQVGPSS